MFGYVVVNEPELKIREHEEYRSYYCGLCHTLHKRYGRAAQMLLNYDMTFLSILLTGLYEPEIKSDKHRCITHPLIPHKEITSDITEYAADMTILLAYQKAVDDWKDDKRPDRLLVAQLLRKDYKKLRKQYPRQARVLEKCVRELSEAEKRQEKDLDYLAGLTGKFLAEMYVWKEDAWEQDLREIGFYLGKFIYLIDAYDDLDKDEKKERYNPLIRMKEEGAAAGSGSTAAEDVHSLHLEQRNIDDLVQAYLEDMMQHAARAFERLPILKMAEIDRNILYSGVWVKCAEIRRRRLNPDNKGKKENDEKSI